MKGEAAVEIRRFLESDAESVARLISLTLRTVNIKDYSQQYIENQVSQITPEFLIQRGKYTHFYLACDGDLIVGCGAIGPYWEKEDESSLFTIFVHPAYQGRGIGRKIIETLESDEYFIRARRVEIPASITACEFYRKMGYKYKGGVRIIDDEELIRMEKFKEPGKSN